MIKVIKNRIEGGMRINLVGSMLETIDLNEAVGRFNGELAVNCKEIVRINSIGVKSWIKYFQKLKQDKVRFYFEECSPPIIDQLNFIANFSCGGEVVSLSLPYSCAQCSRSFFVIKTCAELIKDGLDIKPVRCENGCTAQFEDDPREYLDFLKT